MYECQCIRYSRIYFLIRYIKLDNVSNNSYINGKSVLQCAYYMRESENINRMLIFSMGYTRNLPEGEFLHTTPRFSAFVQKTVFLGVVL